MRILTKYASIAAVATLGFAVPAQAQLEIHKDYTVSDSVWVMDTIKIDANMEDYYLEGLRSTWIASNEVAKKLGHIEDYAIYRSELGASGSFNMVLLTKFANSADLEPNKQKYDAFMKEWGETKVKESRQISKDLYPTIRSITGSYMLRKVDVK